MQIWSVLKKKISDHKYFVFFFLVIVLFLTIFIISINFELTLEYSPEYQEYVIVVDKRVDIGVGGGGRVYEYDANKYLIKFQFPDGSIKELEVSTTGNASDRGGAYSAINIGDEGMLTYKEIENVEGKYGEENRYLGRKFISFERYVVADEE